MAAGTDAAATRVVDAQRQAAGTLRFTLAFAVSAAIAAVVPHGQGTWLPLHLFLVGAVLTAIAAATQMLAVTWSASPAPTDGLVSLQRWGLGLGAVAVVVGRLVEVSALTAAGAAAVLAGLAALARSLVTIRRSGRNDRYHPAIDAYLAALACAGVGVALGGAMAVLDPSTWWVRLRAAHMALNLFGLVGLVLAGTLPYFVATQARMKMAPVASPARIRAVVGALGTAVTITAVGLVTGTSGLAGIGRLLYAGALVALFALLPRAGAKQLRWAGPRLVQLATGCAWWLAATLVLAAADWGRYVPGDPRHVFAVGGVAQILVASLAYLGPVIRGGGHERLTAGFGATRSWPSVVLGNLAAGALLLDRRSVAGVAVALWAFEVLRRAALLAGLPGRPTRA